MSPSLLTATPSGSTPTGISVIALLGFEIDRRQQRVVLVGDEGELAVGAQPHLLGIGAGGQFADPLQGLGVENGDGVVVAEADVEQLLVLRQRDAARPLADLDGLDGGELVEIDDGDRIALLVGDVGGRAPRPAPPPEREGQRDQGSLHFVSG